MQSMCDKASVCVYIYMQQLMCISIFPLCIYNVVNYSGIYIARNAFDLLNLLIVKCYGRILSQELVHICLDEILLHNAILFVLVE